MTDHSLIASLAVSSLLHVILLTIVSPLMRDQASLPPMVPIRLVNLPSFEHKSTARPASPPARPRAKPQRMTPPKLLSRPTSVDTLTQAPVPNKETVKTPEKSPADPAQALSPSPKALAEGERSKAGRGSTELKGDIAIATHTIGETTVIHFAGNDGTDGGGKGSPEVPPSGLGSGFSGGTIVSSFARPLGGYQVKPRYPDSARRAGIQGTTILRLRVLENGTVESVLIQQSAGHHDLDNAAAQAVKQWLFEPARRDNTAIAVWVLVPVKFEIEDMP
jgi:protein TonB